MVNKILFLIIPLILSIGIASSLFLPNVYAIQAPPIIALVDSDPYYFAEGEFGISLLHYLGFPLTPYLTDGVTEKSTDKEIMAAYYKANADVTAAIIEQESDRVISYVLTIQSADFIGDKVSYGFQMFNPGLNEIQFTIESLSNKDNQSYYEFASRYINPGARPQPFDATIDAVTGDGTVLQKWLYYGCSITYFEVYLEEILMYLMYAGGIKSEIRDQSQIECRSRYLAADMDEVFNPYMRLDGPAKTKHYDTAMLNKIPSRNDRAASYLVTFVGREVPEEVTFQTFGKFGQTGSTISSGYDGIAFGQNTPEFFLEGLLSKDKKEYYEYIARYINPGKTPEKFDVNVDVVTGDGTPLLRWQYFGCEVTDFEAELKDSLLLIKFHPGSSPEIRDHTEFECTGFYLEADFVNLFSPYLNLPKTGEARRVASEPGAVISKPADRANSYVVHFSDGDFGNSTKTFRTFPNFKQTALTEFNLQALPSQDKNDLYDMLIAKSMNPGRQPDPFDVTVDIVSGDGTILQKWQYYQCKVSNYQLKLNDILTSTKYGGKNVAEIKETTSFECRGQNLVADPLKPLSIFTSRNVATPTLDPTTERVGGEVPKEETRAMSYQVTIVGTDFPQETFTSFASFKTEGITVRTTEYSSFVSERHPPAFSLESLPSKDKENFFLLLAKYINPGKDPHPFDVKVDIVTGDATTLQSWNYFDCKAVSYAASLADNLLVIKYSPSAVEIRDKTSFECDGFHFETPRLRAFSPYYVTHMLSGETQISNETGNIVPDNNDRPMSYVVHFSAGEIIIPHTYLTFSKYKQIDSTHFWLESLPSQDKKLFYDAIIARYINPGESPQLIDVSVDFVTGDGTILQSWQYHKCSVTDYVTYQDSDVMFTRFIKTIDYEIRDKTTFDCAGLNVDTEGKLPFSLYADIFSKGLISETYVPEIIVQPQEKPESGPSANEIECKREMELMFRPSKGLHFCVDAISVTALQEQGWEHISKKLSIDKSKVGYTNLKAVLPADGERAMSYRINVIGREVPEVVSSIKFSKFAPFTTDDITINTAKILGLPIPDNAFISLYPSVQIGDYVVALDIEVPVADLPLPIPTATIPGDTSTLFGMIPYYHFGDKPSFYLESLPAKDKKEFYEWVSRYTNPGKTPETIDVGVEILDGSGNTLQTWMYRNCSVLSYQLLLDDYILGYKFHELWHTEIKDRTLFSCDGLSLNRL
jgi:hypothetical protein